MGGNDLADKRFELLQLSIGCAGAQRVFQRAPLIDGSRADDTAFVGNPFQASQLSRSEFHGGILPVKIRTSMFVHLPGHAYWQKIQTRSLLVALFALLRLPRGPL